jgi:hypothetical protein
MPHSSSPILPPLLLLPPRPKVIETLDAIMEGACRPLKVRSEAVLTSDPGMVTCFQIANVIHFYGTTTTDVVGGESGLGETLLELRDRALKVFYDALDVRANELLANVELPAADLQPPASLESSLGENGRRDRARRCHSSYMQHKAWLNASSLLFPSYRDASSRSQVPELGICVAR